MEEKCFDTSKDIVMNLSTPAASATTGNSKVQTIVGSSKFDTQQPQRSMSDSLNNESLVLNGVLDDETTNSGLLEVFDQNSTTSTSVSDVNSGVGSVKSNAFRDDCGDCSSTESGGGTSTGTSASKGVKYTIFNKSSLTNFSGNDEGKKCSTSVGSTSQNDRSEILENQTDSVIVTTTGGAPIYLETPVVDEQQHNNSNSSDFLENTAKPKRLSDEFSLGECENSDSPAIRSNCDVGPSNQVKNTYNTDTQESPEEKIDDNNCDYPKEVETDLQHDKMSFRLKKMNINNSANEKINSALDDMPSSSYAAYPQSVVDIESMDLLERRDFETEQRLTGGIILKTSSLVNKNKLNLNLIQTCTQKQQQTQLDKGYDCPSSSKNIRVISSDSKFTYKDPSTTPTSSRVYNSRLTKSTAKLNLCTTLSHTQQKTPQLKQITTADSNNSKLQSNKPSSSSVISEAPSTSGSSLAASSSAAVPPAELYSNSNSNDSLASERCFPSVSKGNEAEPSHTGSVKNCHQLEEIEKPQESAESGCSRTSVVKTSDIENNANEAYDDAQPSTSSARCQYAPMLKNMRQVNASAQTNERYLSRATSSSNVVPSGVNLSTNRLRRKDPTAHLTRNSTSEEVIAAFKVVVAEAAAAAAAEERGEYHDPWADCEENSDAEEICTCHHSASGSSHGGSNTSLNETDDLEMVTNVKDADLSNYIQMVSISEDGTSHSIVSSPDYTSALSNQHQRKRKYNESRLLDNDYNTAVINSGGDTNSRKRIAYDYASTPRSSQTSNSLILASMGCSTPPSSLALTTGSPISRRTPRSIIPTRDNPPPELQDWLAVFQRWSHAERLLAVDRLIENCEPTQVRHMMKVIEPQFQRDFISLLPRELALQVLAYLDPMDLLRAAQTCRSWRFLCDDNLLWKEKCRKGQILTETRTDKPKRGRAGNMPHIASPWKAAYMRQHIIEMNWRSRPIRDPKVLKGHDDHVITCLQFSGNRIVSGSDDNTLKVWSAVTGRCLRTLVGHTGGVWSSQMSGNIIISGSTDRTLKVWDMETGQCVHTLLGHTSTVRCMHLHGKRVVSGSRDATLRVWDIEQGSCLHVLVGHLAAVRCVQYDGKLIVSGAYDYMVKIWHPERQECLHTLQGHTNRVYSLQFDGIHVVSGSLDTSIRVWDAETGNCKHTLMGHQSLTSGMELRQNILVSGNADSTVKVWDITTGQCLQTLSGPNKHQSAVTCLQFNSRFVVTSSDDGTVKLWDVKTGEFIRNLVALDSGGSGGVVWRIRANDTKLICAVGSRNGTEETKLMVLDFDVEGACVKCS